MKPWLMSEPDKMISYPRPIQLLAPTTPTPLISMIMDFFSLYNLSLRDTWGARFLRVMAHSYPWDLQLLNKPLLPLLQSLHVSH